MVGQGRFSAGHDEASEMAITISSGGSRGSRGVEVVMMVDALVALPEQCPSRSALSWAHVGSLYEGCGSLSPL